MSAPSLTALGAGHYVHWGVVSISVANLTIILVMVAIFLLALVLPFPHGRPGPRTDRDDRGHRP
ncbi:MAG: hypothetical protein ACXVEC_15070 [Nocardioides sp.]